MRKITDKVQIAKRKQYRRDYANQYYRLRKNADTNYRRQYRSQHHTDNINHDHELNKEYYLKYREQRLTRNKITQTVRIIRLKTIVLSHYSNDNTPSCVLCGFNNLDALSIDHINGNGNQHRRSIGGRAGVNFYYWLIKNHFPDGYRTLCMNCQFTESTYLNNPNRPIKELELKYETLRHYGNNECSCVLCRNTDIGALTIDHVNNNGNEQRGKVRRTGVRFYDWLRRNSYPKGYQTLCMNCQRIKDYNRILQ